MNTIILKKELEDAAYQCRHALTKAQAALKELLKLADYPTPSRLEDITSASLVAFVQQRINAVKATQHYRAAEKERITNDWTEWQIKAMPHVAAVEAFYNDWKDVAPKLYGGTITTADITEALTPRYTVQVPLQAHTHLQLINSVRGAISELRAWESQQDTKKIPLQKLLGIKEDDLLQSWCSGSIKIDHSQDNAGAKLWREAFNANIL